MKWAIAQLIKQGSKVFEIDELVDFSDIVNAHDEIRKLSKVKVTGTGQLQGKKVVFNLHIEGTMTLACALTLDDVEYPFDYDSVEVFVLDADLYEEGEDEYLVTGTTIELAPVIWQNILLQKPLRVVKEGAYEEMKKKGIRIIPYYSEKYPPKYTKEKATAEAGAAHSGNLRSNYFWHDVMPGTEDVEKPVYRKEPVYATKYYYEIDKWTVVDTAKSSGNDQNPSWPEPKLKDGQRTGAEEEHYFVTATYEKKKGKTETGRYEMDFSQWKELKKGEKIELKIDAAGFAEINQK